MKNYNAEIYIRCGHGRHGASYHGLTTMEITANNKKEAKEIVKELMQDYEFISDPITGYVDKAGRYDLTIDLTEIK